ncbi:cytrochrome C oxidoreductase subunit B [Ralstonia sp. NT80]|nr:cytrochrome C oxidoreductase subunit B [Ralstonia sp. NT80]
MREEATMLNRKTLRSCLALATLMGATTTHALDVTLPPETAQYKPSDLPGYRLVLQNCMICHAAQYVQTQPPTLPRSYWEATVKKMKVPFGAPFPEEDIPAMVDYLVKTYGAERPQAGPAK